MNKDYFKILKVSLLCLFFLSFSELFSQDLLQNKIQFSYSEGINPKQLLDSISNDYGFYFSYESKLLELDSPVKISKYSGTLENFLYENFGKEYTFKEIPKYIIIRYAPFSLDLDAEMNSKSRNVTIKGQITNLTTHQPVSNASIYDKNKLASTLTDEKGYFKLKYKETGTSIWLTLSKENYRDTTFLLLPTVNIVAEKERNRLRFIPDDGSAETLEDSYFGRIFIGFGQRIQRINLGGYFAETPFQMSLIPGLSSRGLMSSQSINKFSFNVLGGYTAGVEGLEVAGIFNINQKDVKSVQVAGIFNVVGGTAKGLQVAGIYNSVFKSQKGLQVGGIYNHVHGSASGMQVAGILNQVDSSAQFQIAGIKNSSLSSSGLQVAGITNQAKLRSDGTQIAGIWNQTKGSARVQISGIYNKAKQVSGFQIGLINRAESSDYSFGLLNFIDDGEKNIGLSFDESTFSRITFRSGGRKFYGVLGLAFQVRPSDTPIGIETGLGIHLVSEPKFRLDLEYSQTYFSDFSGLSNQIQSLRLLPEFLLSKRVTVIAGPSLNFAELDKGQEDFTKGIELFEKVNYGRSMRSYLGMTGGIQFIL